MYGAVIQIVVAKFLSIIYGGIINRFLLTISFFYSDFLIYYCIHFIDDHRFCIYLIAN